jgi:hypothetical protein
MKKIDHQNFDNQVNTQEKSNVEDKVVLKNQKNLMKSKNTNAQKLKDRVSKIKSYV